MSTNGEREVRLDEKVIRIVSPSSLETLKLDITPFIATFVGIDADIVEADLASHIRTLLSKGACYLMFVGTNSEKAHDLADQIKIEFENDLDNTIITTWHHDDSLQEVLESALFGACPTEGYDFAGTSYVFIPLAPLDPAQVEVLIRQALGRLWS